MYLFEEDRDILRELARKSKDPKERERLRALYILSIGETVERVMVFFAVEESTVYRWIDKWKEDRNMHDKPRDGRPPSIGPDEKKEIKELVNENDPRKHGINANCWDTKELREFFASKGFANEPKRCPTCRRARKVERNGGSSGGGSYGDRGPRQMYPATCGQCGKQTEVPFQPRGDKPVLCRDCYTKSR